MDYQTGFLLGVTAINLFGLIGNLIYRRDTVWPKVMGVCFLVTGVQLIVRLSS